MFACGPIKKNNTFQMRLYKNFCFKLFEKTKMLDTADVDYSDVELEDLLLKKRQMYLRKHNITMNKNRQ